MGKKKKSKKQRKKKKPGFFQRHSELIRNIFSYVLFFFILGIGYYIYTTDDGRIKPGDPKFEDEYELLDSERKMRVLLALIQDANVDPQNQLEKMIVLLKDESDNPITHSALSNLFLESKVIYYFVDFMQNDTSLLMRELSTRILGNLITVNSKNNKINELMKYDLMRILFELLYSEKESIRLYKSVLGTLSYLCDLKENNINSYAFEMLKQRENLLYDLWNINESFIVFENNLKLKRDGLKLFSKLYNFVIEKNENSIQFDGLKLFSNVIMNYKNKNKNKNKNENKNENENEISREILNVYLLLLKVTLQFVNEKEAFEGIVKIQMNLEEIFELNDRKIKETGKELYEEICNNKKIFEKNICDKMNEKLNMKIIEEVNEEVKEEQIKEE